MSISAFEALALLQKEIDHAVLRKRPELSESSVAKNPEVDQVIGALEESSEVERYLINRRSTSQQITLDDEGAVQDFVYMILRPWIHDLGFESPAEKVVSRYVIKDFRSKALKLIVEAKIVRNKDHGKSITKELHDDIEMYSKENDYEYIVFFVYDPNRHIPDVRSLREHIHLERSYGGRLVTFRLVVRPS